MVEKRDVIDSNTGSYLGGVCPFLAGHWSILQMTFEVNVRSWKKIMSLTWQSFISQLDSVRFVLHEEEKAPNM